MKIEEIKEKVNILEIVEHFGLDYKKVGFGEFAFYDNGELSDGRRFNITKNLATDFSNKNRPQGDVINFVAEHLNTDTKGALQYLEKNFFCLNDNKKQQEKQEKNKENLIDIWKKLPPLNQNQIDYLAKRKIDFSKVNFLKNYNGAIGMILSNGDKAVSFCARKITDDYKNRFISIPGYNGVGIYKTKLNENEKNLIVCEGLFDFLSIRQFYQNVVGLRNFKSGIEIIKDLSEKYNIILIPDNDKAGKETIEEMKKITNFYLLELGKYKDFNDFLLNEKIDDVFFKELENITKFIKKNKEETNLSKAINKFEWYSNRINKFGMLGEGSQFPVIDKITSGIIPGKVYTIGAFSNVGKSKFSYNYVNHFLEKGKKVLFFSLEVDVGMLIGNIACNRYKKDFYSLVKENIINEKDFENLKLYDEYYYLEEIEEITKKEKADYVFIDFIQNIQTKTNKSGYEETSYIAKKIQKLAIETNSTIFSLSQLSNMSGKEIKNGNFDEVNLKGAGELMASSDVVFLLRKSEKEKDIIEMNIKKNKYGKRGETYLFKVDFSSGIFTYISQLF